jgi:hypothetical protein
MADKPHLLPHLVDIDALSRQASHLDSMVAMLNHYFESTADGGDELSPELLTGYLWQMQCTIFDLKDSIQLASDNQLPREHQITLGNTHTDNHQSRHNA